MIKGFTQGGGGNIQVLEYPTDHFFSDYRLEVSDVVTEFFKDLAK